MRKLAFCFTLLALAIFAPLAIQAQTTGSLSGTVTDPNGAVVPGAKVEIKKFGTGESRSTTTADNGVFNFQNLAPGEYSLTVEAAGFKKALANDIVIEVTKPSSLSIAMEVGAVGETITVSGSQEVINTTSPTITNVISTRQVQDLPLASRNPMDLAGLQAGIAVTGTGTRTASVGGLRGSATNVTQDGINAMDNFVKTDSFFAISSPSLNSVDEFSITTGTTGSEAGRGAAQANFVTRSGTNDYHGNLFYQQINSALQSNFFFNNQGHILRPDQHQHYYGFTVGGPIYFPAFGDGGPKIWDGHDKAFFFFSYEGFREHFGQTRNRTVLTAPARTGLFSYNRTCPNPPGSCTPGVQTVNLLTAGTFSSLNPLTMAQITAMPLPNNSLVGDGFNTGGYQFNVTGSDPSDKWVGRYDHTIFEHGKYGGQKLEFVYNRAHFILFPDTFNSIEAPFPGGVNAGQESKRSLFTVALHSTFGNSMTNTFRYGRQWAPVGFIRESNPTAPFITLASVTNFDNTFMSQGRNTTVNQYIDDFSWTKGSHLIQFGGDFQKVFADTFNDAGINQNINLGGNTSNSTGLTAGSLPFSASADLTRANAVYSDLVGLLASTTQTFNVQSPTSGFVPGFTRARIFQERDFGTYIKDQWRFKSNITLNLGVRWEFQGVPTIPNGLAIQVTNFDDIWGVSGKGNLFNPNRPTGAPPAVASLDFVSGDTGKPLYNDDWNNFAPFIGVAYSPQFKGGFGKMLFGSPGHSSFRAGYSISYLHDGFTVVSNALGTGVTNPGLIQSSALNTPTGVLTAAGLPLPIPAFVMPVTDKANFDFNSSNGLWAIDPNLKTPYVQQWNVGFEREIFPNTALEVRYVGNHAIKVFRAYDLNEVNIFENGFLNEFTAAQRNLALYRAANPNCGVNATGNGFPCRFGNVGLPGQINLPNMGLLFNGFSATSGSGFASSTFIGNLDANNVGTMASSLAFSNTYKTNRTLLPQNYFVANPNAAFARVLANDSMSNYHSLQIEVRRRFSQGLQFQADYTFSKSLTDATDAAGSQSDLVSFRTLRDKHLDYRRANTDQNQRFVAQVLYELPFGKGKPWLSSNGWVDQIVGHWNLGSIVTWQGRPPWYVAAGRATFNSFNTGNNPAKLLVPLAEFQKHVGLYKDPRGIFFIDPAILDITTRPDGRVLTSKIKPGWLTTPAPGEFGDFPLNSLNGPRYFNIDLSVTKRWPITESVRLELKTTFINLLNHPNFIYGTQNFDSTTFGVISGQSGNNRIIHFIGTMTF